MADKKKSKTAELKEQVQELTNSLQRARAELENYQKRVERDREQQQRYASEGVLKRFLPILDNLELALKHCTQQDDFYRGVEMIYANIRSMLEEEGVKPIQALGLPFDPYRHEALLTKESDQPENAIVDVMQQGYTYHDKVLRPAKVAISKNKTGGKEK
ncbi:nucleotide exchange factor GrpE [Candidatus Woesearchaeota archaeon]|nr:nucleotide exchange factor GrpE [Candidatus Woesearchaeota archaeon]